MASPKTPKRIKLQVNTRHSVGIELEFLVAYLPTGVKDPFESDAASLPPLLRIDEKGWGAQVEAMGHIRKTLRGYGIDVANPSPSAQLPEGLPRRLQNKNMWEVGLDESLHEQVYDGFGWFPIEVRSPALWAREETFEEIRCVVNLLTFHYRLRVNPTCGFHVHVGNGRNYFPANTIKRLGGLLWAADPMLSRLHAPWRRINRHCPSIRYLSKLACDGKGAADIAKSFGKRWANRNTPIDPIAVTDFSDTSLEVKEYGSKKLWEYIAYIFKEVGPFMTFGEDLDDVKDYKEEDGKGEGEEGKDDKGPKQEEREEGSEENAVPEGLYGQEEEGSEENAVPAGLYAPLHEPGVLMPHFKADENDTDLRGEAKELINRLIDEAIPSTELPPEEHTLHRNLAWARWDELEDDILVLLDRYCEERYGHIDLRALHTTQQINLMLDAQCTFLFGHADVGELSIDQQSQLLERCSKYFEAGRSSFRRNNETNRWELEWWEVGPMIEGPNAGRETKINAPYVLRKFENLVGLMDMQDENNDGIEYVNRSEHDGALESMKNLEGLFDGLRDYAELPPTDYKKDVADYKDYGHPKTPAPADSDGSSSPASSDDTSSPADSDGDFAPAAFEAAHAADAGDTNTGDAKTGDTNTSEPPQVYEKLKPHDPNNLPAAYVDEVNRYTKLPDALWDRIGWIPSIAHPLPDPAAALGPGDYLNLATSPTVSTAQGIYELASCTSALAAATLLQGARPVRNNYNFDHYTEDLLEDGFAIESRNPRTVEFREAEGTLDAPWIVAWARICVGIVRFARRAPLADYLRVLERLQGQEDRDLARRAALAAGAADEAYEFEARDERARYDVCDLLEDLGLFAEAAFVRKRERTRERDMLSQVHCKLPRRSKNQDGSSEWYNPFDASKGKQV
ncbi:putative amidoligase enzyme-domain-containing protein [Hypoxylon rubiginosum]|uniref:Amidoligase enzyme-domain-containing protein n=1 Tax=Hypoxylon rubiginosum TaxID=110542 RepID=A0ACB9Z176_9PEZI|nr:putative amidoligase enzyme-domain-containing protein [Hypoxylon rubiginosum]